MISFIIIGMVLSSIITVRKRIGHINEEKRRMITDKVYYEGKLLIQPAKKKS